MNIWVCEIDDAGTLGFASPPGYAAGIGAPNTDGLVITPSAFGLANVTDGVNLGRTVTHEVGHYFSLYHPLLFLLGIALITLFFRVAPAPTAI